MPWRRHNWLEYPHRLREEWDEMRLRQILLWTGIVILALPLAYCTRIAAINYSGYCFEQGRYLSDDERIREGIASIVVLHYPLTRFVPDEMPSAGRPRGNGRGIEITKDQLILYRDAEEFVAINPGCCNFGRRGLYGEVGESDLWTKVTGYSAGFFNAKYQIRYRDSKGHIQSSWTGITFHLQNCGRGNQYF